jgi:RHS repeat-associated protein
MTRVSKKSAWEYCIYVGDNDYGLYQYLTNYHSTNYQSMPYGMSVTKTPGPAGIIKIKIAKSLLSNASVLRFTISTFNPSAPSNTDSLYQGGSSAVDVFPGTPETFGGEIPGYGQITTTGTGAGIAGGVVEYTKYYIYDGINPIVEYAPNGSILARYIYAGGLHIAKIASADTNWYHCDALGSPRKMTNESGSVVWTGAYYPFGEMITGTGDVHGFTGKELDNEMGLNYFCQRYYDSQIGRFITLDKWTHLPDDERVFSYAKYLSWDNYQLKYNPRFTRIPKDNSFIRKSYTTSYDSLTNEINSIFPTNPVFDFSDSVIYFRKPKDRNSPVFRYYQVTEQFQNQLNGYRYCWNNPVRYTDPTGNWGSAKDFYVAYCSFLGTAGAALLGLPWPVAGLVSIGAGILGDIYWDYCMQVEWYVSNFCVAPPDFGYYNNQ